MTPKQRVMRTFEFQEPDAVPKWCGMSDEFREKAKRELGLNDEQLLLRFGDDFRRVYSQRKIPLVQLPEGITWESPFGVQRTGIGYGQPTSHPLCHIETLAEAEAYPWPDPDMMDVSSIREQALKYRGEYAILGGEWSPFWHDVIDLVEYENLCYLMYDHPDIVSFLFERVTDFYCEVNRKTFEAAGDLIDIFFFGNDLGSQTGPLLGKELFAKFLLPSFSRLIDLGHHYGLKVMLHCCGGYRPLIPLLIEAGLDGLHALQPDARGMEPRSLKQEFGRKIVLNGAIDSHHILINGPTPEFVREKTLQLLSIMAPGGGYIAGASHDTILPETPVENVLAMFDAVWEYSSP